ncbi:MULTISPECIES: FAD-binding oxidoreductase [unclassified Streptomyces]|uniref:FAD-binding oxidoreductase n=1 Tax=unclassified Streptomyces TaxID=2593676 RepID=UPI000DABF609|nr:MULTISPECIES: FAD-binding protein [unclassified Streptomyces]PZT74842.1 FAD-binding oxidoreductase [Streptomyces sp. AC1-42T]PZT82174.1 FAD-binding oxidoreductase [Streptomyces sp. AC1-42W]
MTTVPGTARGPALTGTVLRPGDAGYDEERLGYNRALDHRPAVVVGAHTAEDVRTAVRYAAGAGLAVAVQATGHGLSHSAEAQLMISTRRMNAVGIDPESRTATVAAGASWHDVLARTAPHGLAPLSGSNPGVGAVGYTVGGGLGLLGRRFGYAADHVRRLDVVTADGRLRIAGPECEPDLFWALRGGKGGFGVVVSMEIGLFPVARLYGGGLYFGAEHSAAVLHTYARWCAAVPDEMSSSVQLIGYPDLPAVPQELRGRHITHIRVAFSGDPDQGKAWVRPLRAAGTALRDTVTEIPYAEAGSIHHEPPGPVSVYDRNAALRELSPDAVDALLALAGPGAGAPYFVEIRHHGGAYARSPEVPNAVAGRDAGFLLFSTSVLGSDGPGRVRAAHDELYATMRPWGTGGAFVNFFGIDDTSPERVRGAYRAEDHARLVSLKERYDPDDLFRLTYGIGPHRRRSS